MWWQLPASELKGIGPKKAHELRKLNIETIGDILGNYPRLNSYIDYSEVKKISELTTGGERQLFAGEIVSVVEKFSQKGKRYSLIVVTDGSAFAEIYFFARQRFLTRNFAAGSKVLVTGRVKPGRTARNVTEAVLQPIGDGENIKEPGILPVYSLAGSLTQTDLRKAVRQALALAAGELPESLPAGLVAARGLPGRFEALSSIHFPESFAKLQAAKNRFVFEELFLLQCGLHYYRYHVKTDKNGVKHGRDGALVAAALEGLPFELTAMQKKAWEEISLDMQDARPMHRLLQGDVGSGKTVVSALALAKTAENGFQGCIMVPTEILAQQHYATLEEYLKPAGCRVELLTSSTRAAARKEILRGLADGAISVVVGTHSLIQNEVAFKSLALVVTDEQHRFGVEQRARLANKSNFSPDVLVMTATPIPRTLALTVYGDLDVSVMKGLPPGRKPIMTLCYTNDKRAEVYAGVLREVGKGRQAYVVCPLIEESEAVEASSASAVHQELVQGALQGVSCALLHGRMKDVEKEKVMEGFVSGEISVLVATTVIEVGVNVPNASLMVIETADRFGLAQLHQLRGRVGRGSEQSYCVMLTDADKPEALTRLQIMRDCSDGFLLAEKDLELRGAGQLFGLRQHGLPDLRIADILQDMDVLIEARDLARRTMSDPKGAREVEAAIKYQLDDRFCRIFNL